MSKNTRIGFSQMERPKKRKRATTALFLTTNQNPPSQFKLTELMLANSIT